MITKLDSSTEKEREFLDELLVLSKKHGIVIGGCGCCGSPYLHDAQPRDGSFYVMNGDYADELRLIEPGDYYWERHHERG